MINWHENYIPSSPVVPYGPFSVAEMGVNTRVLAIFDVFTQSNQLTVKAHVEQGDLIVHFKAAKSSPTPITGSRDWAYIWNENEFGYRYYMIGEGPGKRENLWTGVGHAQNTDLDYLMITIRNIRGQFGKFYPQSLVKEFNLNGTRNPGRVEDGGFGIYPERIIENHGIEGVER